MIRLVTVLAVALLLLAGQVPAAEEIVILPAEIGNLGIETDLPAMTQEATAIKSTATVVVPPMGDAIVSVSQAGLLARLNVAIGEEVVRGQVLATLQSPEFIALQSEFLHALNTNLLAQNEHDRDQQLFEEGIISGRRLQETQTRARIAAAGLNEHRQLLQISGLSSAEIHALESRQELQQQLEIRAPFDGVILERLATAGERLDAMSPVYRLADLTELWLEIKVPQELLSAVHPGMKVAVVDSPVPYPAVVTTVGKLIDSVTQAVIVRATINSEQHGLSPGQFVAVQIIAGNNGPSAGLLWNVPVSAVTKRGDSFFVFVRSETGFDAREVQVVSDDAQRVTLRGPIAAEDRIVVV
jgi:cobalt-zinc-cadmium efflux system membrane fusion protein